MIDSKNLPHNTSQASILEWEKLINMLRFLRSDQGCPWDKEQTVASLRSHMIEESTELLEAIGNVLDRPSECTHTHLQEELGDVLLVITMMIIIYEETEHSDGLYKIINTLNEKLIRRHPHVFGDVTIETHEQLATQWQDIKRNKEGKKIAPLSEYKDYMHILERTKELQKKMSKEYGLLGASLDEKQKKLFSLLENFTELEKDLPDNHYSPSPTHVEQIVGEALFSLIDIARMLKVSPTAALSRKIATEIQNIQDRVR